MSFVAWLKKLWEDPPPDVSPADHVPEITSAQVAEIKRMYREKGYSQQEIGRVFGIHQSQVSRIISGESHGDEP